MARTHGKILCSIWRDDDYRALRYLEQWTFEMLVSQSRINLAGCIDLFPDRWSLLASDITESDIQRGLKGLEAAGFVCVDADTRELLVRSFTKNDGIPIANPKLRKGLWGAWEAIASARLRKIAVDNMPPELFDHDHPPEADRFRRSAQIDCPPDSPIEQANDSSLDLPPTTTHLPTPTDARSVAQPDFDPPDPPLIPDENRDLAQDAIAQMRDDIPFLQRPDDAPTTDRDPTDRDQDDEHQEPDE